MIGFDIWSADVISGLAAGSALGSTFNPTLGPSKNPLNMAPRQIAVRLNHAHQICSCVSTNYGN